MSVSFSVLDQAWIPVVTMDGREEMLGIREVLGRSQELREISSAFPLEEYSLYRFLGLFLMDMLRPESELEIEDLLAAGRFDMQRVEEYIAACKSEGVSFDLFDEERPFLQSKYDAAVDGDPKPVSILDCTRASGNNHTHFDHQTSSQAIPADKAARLLLSTYLFCTAAAQGYPSGVNASPPYFGVIQGQNLFETLAYTHMPLDSIGITSDSPPVLWRRVAPIIPKQEVGKTSWLHGMLFPTRRIHLVPNEQGAVTDVHLCQGENFVNKQSWHDPYVTYRNGKDGFFPMRPSADRAIWRNLSEIVNIPGGQASQLLTLYRNIQMHDVVNLTLYGVETSQASYLGIYRHSLSFPMALTTESRTVDALRFCITAAETLANALRKALSKIEVLPETAASLAVQKYYQDCETRFWAFSDQAAAGNVQKEDLSRFCNDISDSAEKAFSTALEVLNLRAASLAAAEQQRNQLFKSIQKLKKEASL